MRQFGEITLQAGAVDDALNDEAGLIAGSQIEPDLNCTDTGFRLGNAGRRNDQLTTRNGVLNPRMYTRGCTMPVHIRSTAAFGSSFSKASGSQGLPKMPGCDWVGGKLPIARTA